MLYALEDLTRSFQELQNLIRLKIIRLIRIMITI